MKLNHLTDKALLADTQSLVKRERQNTTAILYHLKEIERRRLFSELGYSSLFDYAVKELKYPPGAAMRRIHSARLLKEIPEIKSKIQEGTLSLTTLAQAGQLFKNENIKDQGKKKEILKAIEGKSSRETGKVLLELLPPKEDLPKEKSKQVSANFHFVSFNLSQETLDLLQEIRNVLAPKKYSHDELLKLMGEITIDNVRKKKFRLSADPAPDPQGSNRHITNSAKKFIYTRDGGKCLKCGSTYDLQYDHITPYSLGGKSTASNLRLLCRSCNQRQRITARL